MAADHAQSCHIEDHGDGEGHQTHDDEVNPQTTVGVGNTQCDCVVFGETDAIGSNTDVAATVFKGDHGDVQDALLCDLPLLTCSQNA